MQIIVMYIGGLQEKMGNQQTKVAAFSDFRSGMLAFSYVLGVISRSEIKTVAKISVKY